LVDNLLDLSKLEAGAAEPRREWLSVEEVLGMALEDLAPPPSFNHSNPPSSSNQSPHEEFHVTIDRDLPLVRADSTQLERAFVNVLENARRHSGGHPVSVRARVVRTMAGEGDRLIVRVVDRGPGIPPAQLERVFEPFYSAGTARGGRRDSGLGLAIARGFLEANGGSLHVESLPGQGATFVFELPLERNSPEAVAAVAARVSGADGG
jgi:two-component system, OmpR family, sensor histidine kinase KdpD